MKSTDYFIYKDYDGNLNWISKSDLIRNFKKLTNSKLDTICLTKYHIKCDIKDLYDPNFIIPVRYKSISRLGRQYLRYESKFEWFISRYFTENMLYKLRELVFTGKDDELYKKLNDIWFILPDHIFNIVESPDGWNEFLSIVDNDYYKSNIKINIL